MLKMVTDLLDVARIDQGKAIFEKNNLNLEKTVEDSMADLQGLAAEKNNEINFQADPNLPAVCVDERKMRVVLDNLIGNAIKYSREGGKVEIKLKEEGGKIIFSVQDWGVGIPQHQHNKIFEKFFRSKNEARYRTEGVGIGLYLARAILKHCGGEVWFKSEAGEGSTFFFNLPIAN